MLVAPGRLDLTGNVGGKLAGDKRGKGFDGVAERGVVDKPAVPIGAALLVLLDIGPGELRRQAPARNHVAGRDRGRGRLVNRAVGEALQLAVLYVDGGDHEGGVALV